MPEHSGVYLSGRKSEYLKDTTLQDKLIEDAKGSSRNGNFPGGTIVPEGTIQGTSGGYFDERYHEHKQHLLDKTRLRDVGVDSVDNKIGFAAQYIGKTDMKTEKAEGKRLRKLLHCGEGHRLVCQSQRSMKKPFERSKNRKPESFMRIISVSPEPSVAAPPTALVPNPQYRPEESG